MAEIGSVLGLDFTGKYEAEKAETAIRGLTRIFQSIGIVPALSDLGLPREQVDWTADQAIGI